MTLPFAPDTFAKDKAEALAAQRGLELTHPQQWDFLQSAESLDLQAAPGSGKTSLIGLKLTLLAQGWSSATRGICVLSHTNTAKDEITHRLSDSPAGRRLLGFPHFIGTIQSFTNTFLALPALRSRGIDIQTVDDAAYEHAALRLLDNHRGYFKLKAYTERRRDGRDLVAGAHYICDAGELTVTGPTGTLPFKSTSPSGQQLIRLKNDLADQGLFRYSDMFAIAEHHLLHHPDIAQATAHRFPFVLLDEMQDTSDLQQHLLDQVFGKVGTVVQRAGDVNQGIFTDRTQAPLLPSAFPHSSAAQLPVSRRFGTQIADLASRLTVQRRQTIDGVGPQGTIALLLFDDDCVPGVIPAFERLTRETVPDHLLATAPPRILASRLIPGKAEAFPQSMTCYLPTFTSHTAAQPALELITTVRAARALLATGDRRTATVQTWAPAERSRLRTSLALTAEAVAHAIGVSPATLHAWEEGQAEPQGPARDTYAYFLTHARTCATDQTQAAEPHLTTNRPAPDDSTEFLPQSASCVLCGNPATHQVDGYPQHLTVAECAEAATPAPALSPSRPEATPKHLIPHPRSGVSQRFNTRQDPIGEAVVAALDAHNGDQRQAVAALTARAIADAMQLLDECRVGARYDIVRHPALPEMLRKPSPHAPDRVWEARPDWQRAQASDRTDPVAELNVNGAYLAALKTHLPLGQLRPTAPYPHDRRRAGIHLITPSAWEHDAYLPNPLGLRPEPGPIWITESTLRLLLRLSSSKHALCDPPVIHESYTSGSTENLLEKFRTTLRDARARALEEEDTVTLEYVKALYSQFVSTLGESRSNRDLHRPDWMHIIRAQAFANLWSKAYKAHAEGLILVRVRGTDELHLQGEWRRVFQEGRDLTQVKLKDTYEVAALYPEADAKPQKRCNDPYIEKRRYEYAGGRYVGCRSCGGDLCTLCRTAHLVPADIPYEDNDDNVCPACR